MRVDEASTEKRSDLVNEAALSAHLVRVMSGLLPIWIWCPSPGARTSSLRTERADVSIDLTHRVYPVTFDVGTLSGGGPVATTSRPVRSCPARATD